VISMVKVSVGLARLYVAFMQIIRIWLYQVYIVAFLSENCVLEVEVDIVSYLDLFHLINFTNVDGMFHDSFEASATGLPIVATNVGGNSEVVLDGITGFLVPPRNPEALAEAMLRMMDLPEEKRREMGKAARKHIEENFGLDRVVDMWEALYKELLEQKGRR